MLLLAQIVKRQVNGGAVQEGPRVGDLLRFLHAQQSEIGVLGQVGCRMPAADDPPQTRNQFLLMGLKQAFEIERR